MLFPMFLSASKFYNILDGININLGTALAIVVVGGGLLVSINKLIKDYNKMITEKSKTEEDMKKTLASVNDLVGSVKVLQNEIIKGREYHDQYRKDINNKLDSLAKLIENERETSRRGDEVITKQMSVLSEKVDVIDKKSNLLIESDKEGIKGNITEKYYKAMNDGYIEIHTLESLEAQYEKYLEENGNTFVSGLMDSLRVLPHTKPKTRVKSRKRQPNVNSDNE